MKTGVYKITNHVNGKVYIGASKNIEKRWWEHRRGFTAIADDLKTFGLENFKFEILLECPETMLAQWERDMICLYDADDPEKGYNCKNDRPYSLKLSEALKGQKAWNKGIPCSEETKRKLSEANKGKPAWNKGKPARNKGIPCSEEHKRKISEARKGHKHTEEAKRKISETNRGKHNITHSDEAKRKMSEARRLYLQKKKENI